MELRVAVEKRLGSFTLRADFAVTGDRLGLTGASGSGKSTLAAVIAGLKRPDAGEVHLDGTCLYSARQGIDLPADRRRVALVFQDPSLFPHLNVKNNLLYGFKRCAPEHRSIDFSALVATLKLEQLLDRGIHNLSGGEKQRVALGRAVLAHPRLLLMDEPLTGLDDPLKLQVIECLKGVNRQFGIPYLLISHSRSELQLMTDQLLVATGAGIAQQALRDPSPRGELARPQSLRWLRHSQGALRR